MTANPERYNPFSLGATVRVRARTVVLFVVFLFIILSLNVARAATHIEPLPDAVLEARAIAIGDEVRCVVCQSSSINDSQADMAADLRKLVREKIAMGWSDPQILDFLRVRYGDFILLKPPIQPNTYLLWILPALFLAMGSFYVWAFLAQGHRKL